MTWSWSKERVAVTWQTATGAVYLIDRSIMGRLSPSLTFSRIVRECAYSKAELAHCTPVTAGSCYHLVCLGTHTYSSATVQHSNVQGPWGKYHTRTNETTITRSHSRDRSLNSKPTPLRAQPQPNTPSISIRTHQIRDDRHGRPLKRNIHPLMK